MICKKCNKDHKVKNEGRLTVCELKEYFSGGGVAVTRGRDKYRAFGIGERFQFEGAR